MLGFLENGKIIHSTEKKPFIARKIITILPQRYASIEKRALEIMESTKFNNDIKGRLEYIFF